MTEPAESNVVWGFSDEPSPDMWPNHTTTREEAIALGHKKYPGEPFYVASGYRQAPEALFLTAADYIEDAEQRASEDCEDGNEFVHVADGGREALQAFLDDWLSKYVKIDYWIVDGTSERIEANDVA